MTARTKYHLGHGTRLNINEKVILIFLLYTRYHKPHHIGKITIMVVKLNNGGYNQFTTWMYVQGDYHGCFACWSPLIKQGSICATNP